MASKYVLPKEGQPYVLPIEIPAKVEGKHGNVEFNGKGKIKLIPYPDSAIKEYGYDPTCPWKLIFIDDKTGPLLELNLGQHVLGWYRAFREGRLAKRNGVDITWSKDGIQGRGFFDVGSGNERMLLEFGLNKQMGWSLLDKEDCWTVLTASSAALEWPKELWHKVLLREHFFKNSTNISMLYKKARGRMQHDPAVPLPLLSSGEEPEMWWVCRYVQSFSHIERYSLKHPELANLFPHWTSDSLATKSVEMMQSIDYKCPPLEAVLQNKVFLGDIAGNVIGLGEGIDRTEPVEILCPEEAVEALQVMRTDRIDSPTWLAHKGGIDFINKQIEFTELLLAGRVEEAKDAMSSMFALFQTYLKNGAQDKGKDFKVLWLERQPRTLAWQVLLAYVTESVKRGIWKPVNITPIRVRAPVVQ